MSDPVSFALRFIVAALACFRLAELIVADDGPADVFLRLRTTLGAYDRDETGRAKTSLGRGVSCAYCVGIYLTLAGAYLLVGISAEMLPVWLALAGAQAFLQTIGGRT